MSGLKDDIKVSIIIPVYNVEKYISDCIKSVQKQTLKEIEMICVDDGSTDKSGEIIKQLQEYDKRIKYYYQENRGAGNARNNGLSKCRGEYIAFLDSDDMYLEEDALRKLYYSAHNNNARIVASYIMNLRGNEITNHSAFRELCFKHEKWFNVDEYQNDFFYTAYLFQRKLLIENNICFPPYRVYEDPVFLTSVFNYEKNIYFVPVNLYLYRRGHHGSEYFGKNIVDLLLGFKDNLKFAIKNNYQILKERIIKRINHDFYAVIRDNYSKNVELLLGKISDIVGKDVLREGLFPKNTANSVSKVDGITEIRKQYSGRNAQICWCFSFLMERADVQRIFWGGLKVRDALIRCMFLPLMKAGDIYIEEDLSWRGQMQDGLPVCAPDILKEIQSSVCIIVLSENYVAVREHLINLGYAENVDFVDGRSLFAEIGVKIGCSCMEGLGC